MENITFIGSEGLTLVGTLHHPPQPSSRGAIVCHGMLSNRESKKLEKRAEQAEKYAETCVELALYYYTEAQVAILEAIAARKDADEVA